MIPFGRSKLWLAPIYFHYNIGSANGRTLPIGVYGEILTPGIRGLGLIARTQLAAGELAGLTALSRDLLASPFNYLVKEFEEAWSKAAPGEALQFLSARHSSALVLSAANERDLPHQFRTEELRDDRLVASVRISLEHYFVSQLEEDMLRIVWDEPNTFEQLRDSRIPRTNRIQVEELLAA